MGRTLYLAVGSSHCLLKAHHPRETSIQHKFTIKSDQHSAEGLPVARGAHTRRTAQGKELGEASLEGVKRKMSM